MSDDDEARPPLPAEPYRPNPQWEAGWAARDALDRDDADPDWLPDGDHDEEYDRALMSRVAALLEKAADHHGHAGRPERSGTVIRSDEILWEARDAAAAKARGIPTQKEVRIELARILEVYVDDPDGVPPTTFKVALRPERLTWDDLRMGRRAR